MFSSGPNSIDLPTLPVAVPVKSPLLHVARKFQPDAHSSTWLHEVACGRPRRVKSADCQPAKRQAWLWPRQDEPNKDHKGLCCESSSGWGTAACGRPKDSTADSRHAGFRDRLSSARVNGFDHRRLLRGSRLGTTYRTVCADTLPTRATSPRQLGRQSEISGGIGDRGHKTLRSRFDCTRRSVGLFRIVDVRWGSKKKRMFQIRS